MKRMILLILLILPVIVCAYLDWDHSGISIIQSGELFDIGVNKVCSINDDEKIMVWSDRSNEYFGVYTQMVNNQGEVIWDNPIQIDNCNGNCYYPEITVLADGDILIAWTELIDDNFEIKLQKIDQGGNLLWNDVSLDLDFNVMPNTIQMISNDDNSAYLLWVSDNDDVSEIGAVKIEYDGSINSNWLYYNSVTYGFHDYAAVSDGNNGFYIVVKSEDCFDLYINHISETGEKIWGYWGELLYNGNQYLSDIEMFFAEELLYISFSDCEQNLYTVLVDENGMDLWGQPICISSSLRRMDFTSTLDNDGNILLGWLSTPGLYIQKINSSGELLFGDSGLLLYDQFNDWNKSKFNLITDANGIFVNWCENYVDVEIGYASIDYNGTINFLNIDVLDNSYEYIPSLSFQKIGESYCSIFSIFSNFKNQILCRIIDTEGNYLLDNVDAEILNRCVFSVKDWHSYNISGENYFIGSISSNNDKIIMQKINEDGEACIDDPGLVLVDSTIIVDLNTKYIQDEDIFALAWRSPGISGYQIHFMSVNRDGQIINDDMIVTGEANAPVDIPEIYPINNENNAYMILWFDYSDILCPAIKCQKIVDGNTIWQDGGINLTEEVYIDDFISLNNNFLVTSVGYWPDFNYMIQKIGADGLDESWPEEGVLIGQTPSSNQLLVTEEYLLFLEDTELDDNEAILLHKIDLSGNVLTPDDGINLITYNEIKLISAVYNDALYVLWEQYGEGSTKLVVQKFDNNFVPLWEDEGIVIEDEAGYWSDISNSNMKLADNDLLITWIRSSESTYEIIRTQMLSSQGEFLFSYPEIWVCPIDSYKCHLDMDVFENSAIYTWVDGRSCLWGDGFLGDGIFTQKLILPLTDQEDSYIPTRKPLLSNYPNPFNPTTNIEFNVIESGNISLEIFNIKGQKIKTLIDNEFKDKGNYSLPWDGTDNYNREVSSGIFMCKIVGSKQSLSQKMILMK